MAEVVYLNMQSGNGGIVVDVSRTGLGFQAACPVQPDEPMSFRFSSEAIHEIEVTGDLIWTDGDRKRGGLRFAKLPVEVRQQIQRWLDEPQSEAGDSNNSHSYVPPRADLPPSLHEPVLPRRPVQDPRESTLRSREQTPRGPGRSSVPPPFGNARERPVSTEREVPLEPRQRQEAHPDFSPTFPKRRRTLSEWDDAPRSRSTVLAVALTAILAVVATIAVLSILYKREAGETFIRVGELILGRGHAQAVEATGAPSNSDADAARSGVPPVLPPKSQDRASIGDASSSSANEPSDLTRTPAANQTAQGSSDGGNSQPSLGTSGPTEPGSARIPAGGTDAGVQDPQSQRSVDSVAAPVKSSNKAAKVHPDQGDGKAELALARDYLARGSARSRDAAIQLLWVAVGDGNTDAEIELANLYLAGDDGANRNCTQARILLRAAADGGNIVAGQRLEELQSYGCR